MIFVFIFSCLILIYTFVGYPVILGILSGLFGKKVIRKEIYPYVSLIISAYNEEKIIRQKIENCFELDYPKDKLEIIVASESVDKTNDIVREFEGQGVILVDFAQREGKRATLFKTLPLAKGEIIVFSDANAMYRRDAVKKLVRNFSDNRIGCVTGRLKYRRSKGSSIGKGETAYWEFDYVLKMLASRLFSMGGGVNGSILAVRKKLYDPIDKFRGDDYEIACRVEIKGYGVIIEPEAVSYEESSETSRQEFGRKVRLASWNLKSTILLLTEALKGKKLLTAFILFSHRFLRYTTPLWLLSMFVSNTFLLSGFFLYTFVLQLLFYGLALIGLIMEKATFRVNLVFLFPFYFCMVNYAALIGLIKNASGKTEMLWEKAR